MEVFLSSRNSPNIYDLGGEEFTETKAFGDCLPLGASSALPAGDTLLAGDGERFWGTTYGVKRWRLRGDMAGKTGRGEARRGVAEEVGVAEEARAEGEESGEELEEELEGVAVVVVG